ncbi:MAG: MBL fold metallo-hydrolase [Lachnospiraceae bacterium]|nr:MBL fold metallo-hydrolase [Lachnospiraceae bacterium]
MNKSETVNRPRPPFQNEITVTALSSGIYNFSSPPVGFQQYLVIGDENALLIDTGIGVGSLKETVEKITHLPVIVINTHCHPDHAGGNAEFAPAYINPAELDVYHKMATLEFRKDDISHMPMGKTLAESLQPTGPEPVAIEDGAVINLGGREVSVLYTPGHTHGSLSVYDQQSGSLFVGDNISAREVAMTEWNADTVEHYRESLIKMKALNPTRVCTGHKPNILPPESIDSLLDAAEAVLSGADPFESPSRNGDIFLKYPRQSPNLCFRTDNIR